METLLGDGGEEGEEGVMRIFRERGGSGGRVEAFGKILRMTDEREKHLISEFWVKNFGKRF